MSGLTSGEKLVLRLAYVFMIGGWVAGLGCFIVEPEAITTICFVFDSVVVAYVLGRAA